MTKGQKLAIRAAIEARALEKAMKCAEHFDPNIQDRALKWLQIANAAALARPPAKGGE